MAFVLLLVGVSLLVAMVAVDMSRIPNPRQGETAGADAVVVLAGGRGERFESALELMRSGVAPVLVANSGDRAWAGWADIEPFCGGTDEDFDVICVTAEPDDTFGEARTISAFAAERGWREIVLVTTTHHLHRATVHFDLCFDGRVVPVAAAAPDDLTTGRFVEEVGGTVWARLAGWNCEEGADPESGLGPHRAATPWRHTRDDVS